MEKRASVEAADVEGEHRAPPRASKLLLAPKFGRGFLIYDEGMPRLVGQMRKDGALPRL